MTVNVAVNLGRAQVMRAVAAWLEKNPNLPIKVLMFTEAGEVNIVADDSDHGPAVFHAGREAHALYQLAEAVGAEVELAPIRYGHGFDLSARWQVGVVPMVADVRIYQAAVNVRPAAAPTDTRKAL